MDLPVESQYGWFAIGINHDSDSPDPDVPVRGESVGDASEEALPVVVPDDGERRVDSGEVGGAVEGDDGELAAHGQVRHEHEERLAAPLPTVVQSHPLQRGEERNAFSWALDGPAVCWTFSSFDGS